jgi:cyclophilin family peptidyl-prolyl cis-trans isomerase
MARDGFYDGLTFHRVVPQFVLQGGDPDGTGSGGPGFTVTQAPPESYRYKAGDMAMAKRADEPAGASGSQFFLTSSEAGAQGLMQPGSPPLYAVVGHATDAASMTTIGRIDALAVQDGPPAEPSTSSRRRSPEG